MKRYLGLACATVVAALTLPSVAAVAQVSQETVRSLGAPDTAQTRIGTLEFKDGAPTAETASKVYDALDFTRALNVYNNSFRGASALAIVKGFESIGAKPGDVVIFSDLMDLELAVPDGQCRHGLLPRRPRSEQRSAGGRAALGRRRHDQRHVVLVDHRHWRSRP